MGTHVSNTHVIVVFESQDDNDDTFELVHPLECTDALDRDDFTVHLCSWSYMMEVESIYDHFVFPGDDSPVAGRTSLPPGIYAACMTIHTTRAHAGDITEDIIINILPSEIDNDIV